MKSPIAFLQVLLTELEEWCHTSTSRDLKTITARFEHEGWSFLTITLTNFGKDLEKGLDQGFVSHDMFQGFTWHAGLPRFLGGFLENVFDRKDGRLLDNPSITSIRALRQITLMWGKVELPCSDARVARAFEKYVECEQDVRSSDASLDEGRKADFKRISSMIFADVFTAVDLKVYKGEIVPKHGSGSTAEKLLGNKKYNQHEWTARLEQVFPYGEFVTPNWRHFLDWSDRLTILEPRDERPTRVVSVPKTLKTPRIIAIEPTCMQYAQQGLLEAFVEEVQTDDIVRNLISWRSQTPNQRLAMEGSSSGSLATLDLSEASDRVSNQHVLMLLARHPHLREAVEASRSRKADVPGHGVKRLAKFASMGSALCFPFEAIVFTTVIFAGIERALNRQLTKKDVKSMLGKVRVYGDDIIVPVEFVSSVIASLEAFGLKVNVNKSFWTGKFRESCGKDYYNGSDVSIVRVRSMFPASLKQTDELVSTVSLRNQLFGAGFEKTVDWLDGEIMAVMPIFPYVAKTSSALGRHSYDQLTVDRMCDELHKPLVKAYVVVNKPRASKLEGVGALTKYFLNRGIDPMEEKHLQFAGRPVSVDTKTRYVSPI